MYKTQTEQINEVKMIIKVNTQDELDNAIRALVHDKFTLTNATDHFLIFSKFVSAILIERKICCTWWDTNKMDPQYNADHPEPDDYDPCADCSDHACEYGSCSMSRG